MNARRRILAALKICGLATFLAASLLWSRQEPASALGVADVAAGDSHTCALRTAGTVQCWGENDFGQLGDATRIDRTMPVDVSGLGTTIVGIAAGDFHSCALTAASGVQCWGSNSSGQLGNSTTELCGFLNNIPCSTTPVDVSGLASDVAVIAAGGFHTCALTPTGGVQCWGANGSGQLGNGTTTDSTTPVDVSGLTSGVTAITAGRSHTCALSTADGLLCWGQNDEGQLGDSTTTDSSSPVEVSGLGSGVAGIAAGGLHTCAVITSGALKCWGANDDGRLGDGTNTGSTIPLDVCEDYDAVGQQCNQTLSGVAAAAAGLEHTCALGDSGGVQCWGSGFNGQLGDGSGNDSNTPVGVSGLGSGVSAIDAGALHNCAVTTGGAVHCWGRNDVGQLGDGTTESPRTTPVAVSGLGQKPTATSTPTDTSTPMATATPTATATATPTLAATTTPTVTPTGTAAPTSAATATPTEAAAATATPTLTPAPGLTGDANGDGTINGVDAALILQFTAGLLGSLPNTADVNGDDTINAIDAALILQFTAGLLDSLPP